MPRNVPTATSPADTHQTQRHTLGGVRLMNRDLRREFKVDSPQVYDAYPLTAREGDLHDTARRLRAEMLASPPEAKQKSAVWVVHGMGQQVPFETLEQVAEGIIRAAGEVNVADL